MKERRNSSTSLSSAGSKKSSSSLRSATSFLQRASFRLSSRSRQTSASLAVLIDVQPGDLCETVSLVTVREEESISSALVADLFTGTALRIVEVGQGRRVKMTSGECTGWISTKTKLNEPLIVKREEHVAQAIEDFEVGGKHEVKSMVTVRQTENLDSEIITELKPGQIVRILEMGANNKRRAKIHMDIIEGWISVATKQGELLIGKVSHDRDQASWFSGPSSSKIQAVLEAARAGDLDAVRKIAESRGSFINKLAKAPNYLNCSDIRGKTPLIYSAAFGHYEVVKYLVSRNEVDLHATDDTLKNAMHHACKRCGLIREKPQVDIVVCLMKAGSFIEARDHNGLTALMFAAACGNEEVVHALLAAGANANLRDFEGHSPLSYAFILKHHNVAKLLRDYGAVDSESEGGDDEDDEEEATRTQTADSYRVQECASARRTSSDADAVNPGTSRNGEWQGASQAVQPIREEVKPKDKMSRKSSAEVATILRKSQLELDTDAKAAEELLKEESKKPDEGKEGKRKTTKAKEGKSGKDAKEGKKKAGEKKKKEPKMPKAMLEMKADQDRDEEASERKSEVEKSAIAVLEDETEEITDKERATKKLQAMLDSNPGVNELQGAIDKARRHGLQDGDAVFDMAKKTLVKRLAVQEIRAQLFAATEAKDVEHLKTAIEAAKENKLGKTEIAEAEAVLKEEQPKYEARKRLKEAEKTGDVKGFKIALKEAKAAKLGKKELAQYEQLLQSAESHGKVLAQVDKAMKDLDIGKLNLLVQQARDAGMDSPQIQAAEQVLKEEGPKQSARDQLAAAIQESNKEALLAAISVGEEMGLSERELAEAASMVEMLKERGRLVKELKKVVDEAKEVNKKDGEALKAEKAKLSDIIERAKAVGVPESKMADAEMRRRKIHNQIEDLKGAIRVFCRIRPLNSREEKLGDEKVIVMEDPMTVSADGQKFFFDACFMPGTQEEVFEDCKDLVQSAADGYNVTMFAYGQTGAGKTFTMYGCPGKEGTAPRTIHELFNVIERGQDRFTFTVMASMLELYRNDLIDLLAKSKAAKTKGMDPTALEGLNVRTDSKGNVVVENMVEKEVQSPEALLRLLEEGNGQRTVKATEMNAESSRSHLVLIIKIVSVNKETGSQLQGKMLIVDLAGSERLKKSQVTNEMQKEAIEINKSLTALGDVIQGLTTNSKVVPYRNHKLTMLMADSLGGSAKTLMFVNCSPASSNLDETIMSLKYATRAKTITNTGKR